PPFHAQRNYVEINCEGTTVSPNIEAKIEKGFFRSNDRVWTCYRRNYFAVNVSYSLSPWIANGRLYLNQDNEGPKQIQAMAVSLSAAETGSTGEKIELIQHTPKREKEPRLPMKKQPLQPSLPGNSYNDYTYGLSSFDSSTQIAAPQLPLQHKGEQSSQYSPTTHSSSTYQHAFERIQFKSATTNNGKRRGQQQYYCLIVELWANVQNPQDTDPTWIKIATQSSHVVVVRGRSPSHYSNKRPYNASASRGGSGLGVGGPGHLGLSSNGPTYGGGYRNGMSGSGGATMGGGMCQVNNYALDPRALCPSPVGIHSVSSLSSLSGGPVEGPVGDHYMVDEDQKPIYGCDGHSTSRPRSSKGFSLSSELDAPALPEQSIKQEYPSTAALAFGWQIGGRELWFPGIESNRGRY
ncbi:hypothetical protein BCR34DRAFT_450983, partial [Clohesyomyces aquaticus]